MEVEYVSLQSTRAGLLHVTTSQQKHAEDDFGTPDHCSPTLSNCLREYEV